MKKIFALVTLCSICALSVGCDKKPAATGTTTTPTASTTTTPDTSPTTTPTK